MRSLKGKRIAVTGARRSEQISQLITNLGGIPLIRPAQGTVYLQDENITAQIQSFLSSDPDWLILTTGIGTELLVQHAERVGRLDRLLEKMQKINIAARGYKTVKALKKLGLTPTLRDQDGTVSGLLETLKEESLAGKHVVIQFYGDTSPKLTRWLEQRGATIEEILPYRYVSPEPKTMQTLVSEIVNNKVDAVAFTSSPQVRFLFQYARKTNQAQLLLKRFNQSVLAAAVGKVTAETLHDEGIRHVLTPEVERMGSMIMTLADYYDINKRSVMSGGEDLEWPM